MLFFKRKQFFGENFVFSIFIHLFKNLTQSLSI